MTFKKSLQAFKFYDIFVVDKTTFFNVRRVKVSIFKDIIKVFQFVHFCELLAKCFDRLIFSQTIKKRLRKFNGRVRLF
jgi:hypothetical protein